MSTLDTPDGKPDWWPRFMTRVAAPDANGCRRWRGAHKFGAGVTYGRFFMSRRASQPVLAAHRAAYEACIGPVPPGLVIDHLCRVRDCVEPAHMEPVTNAENLARGIHCGGVRSPRTACKHGHKYEEGSFFVRLDCGRTPWRRCRICKNESARRYRAEAKQTT